MRLGEWLRQRTFALAENDTEAQERFKDHVMANNRDGYAEAILTEPEFWIQMGAARWADQAFPVVTMGEKYFAALITARAPKERLPEIRSPWRAFVIEVPANTLTVYDYDDDKRIPILRILVHAIDNGDGEGIWWRWVGFTESGHKIWRESSSEHLGSTIERSEYEHREFGIEDDVAFEDNSSQDDRLFDVIGNLILNTCEAVTNPEYVKEVGGSHERHRTRTASGKKAPTSAEPEARTYIVGKPIKIDCRPALRDYLEGRRESGEVKVAFVVRGHFKPKLSARVGHMVFVEPYEKRKDQEPFVVREHALPKK
jgi:hypothetical protein